MTIIVAVKKEDEILVGADKRVTSGDMIVDENSSKILIKKFNIIHFNPPSDEDEFLIAFSGAYSLFELLKTFKAPGMEDKYTFFEYLYKELIPSLNTYLRRYNFFQDCNGLDGVDWDLLIVYHNQMYSLEYNLGLIEITSPYYASGTARDIAYGSLHTSEQVPWSHVNSKVTQAIKACAAHSTKCNDNIELYQSKQLKNGEWTIQQI